MSEDVAIMLLVLSIGMAKLVATLTPDIAGPGYIAFAVTFMLGIAIARLWAARRRRDK